MNTVSLPESSPQRVSLVESTCSDLATFIIAGPAFSDHPDAADSPPSPDDWLPSERKLATRFGVSRPVIREAMKRLEVQGLVEIRHGRNTKVTCQLQRPLSRSLELQVPNDMDRLRQLNETRSIVEPDLAKLAALRADDADIEALESCHKKLTLSKNDLAAAAKIDAHFHELIARAAGNEILALILSSLGDLGEATRRRTLSTTGIDRAIRHHRKILDAIRDHDEKKAARIMRYHVKQASDDLEESSSAIKSSA